jgi:hypothetical protein
LELGLAIPKGGCGGGRRRGRSQGWFWSSPSWLEFLLA